MILSRRGLLGAFLAAPAIIRTPGLLMPVKRHLDLTEITTFNVLMPPNPLLEDLEFEVTDYIMRTSLPVGVWRELNQLAERTLPFMDTPRRKWFSLT